MPADAAPKLLRYCKNRSQYGNHVWGLSVARLRSGDFGFPGTPLGKRKLQNPTSLHRFVALIQKGFSTFEKHTFLCNRAASHLGMACTRWRVFRVRQPCVTCNSIIAGWLYRSFATLSEAHARALNRTSPLPHNIVSTMPTPSTASVSLLLLLLLIAAANSSTHVESQIFFYNQSLPPRLQWTGNGGYCGEVSTVAAGLR
jgi:hypothetical protein